MVPLVEGDPRDIKLEVEMRELRRLSYLRKLLELPASIFAERAPKACHGECREPSQMGALGMTCCHFYLDYQRYNETLRLELMQRQVVEAGRARHRRQDNQRVESPLHSAYYRDFTGTGVHRRLEHNLQSDPGPPKVNQSGDPEDSLTLSVDDLRRTLGKLTGT